MTPICAIFFFVGYWTDKFLLLKGSSRPPHVDEATAQQSVRFLFLAIILHCIVGVQMLGQQSSFPSRALFGTDQGFDGLLEAFDLDNDDLTPEEVLTLSCQLSHKLHRSCLRSKTES